ncbi:MAG: hypothetical protein LBD45_03015 [Bacteroidales bacterium]|jgi:hypothetical protein|nr:hypothetical protein [Bacteroidales bacterium]
MIFFCIYSIAGQRINVYGGELNHIAGFSKFLVEEIASDALLSIYLGETLTNWDIDILYDFVLEDSTPCHFTRKGNVWFFRMMPSKGAPLLVEIHHEDGRFRAITNINLHTDSYLLRFGVWMAFGVAAAHRHVTSVHASTITHSGKSILFLGESGTGKSTHTSLWLKHIPGSSLLNDDSPFMRTQPELRVCGSPWSGKTPCFKNEETPVAAIVRLRQAPKNEIVKLDRRTSIGALLPSCPPCFAYDEILANMIHSMISDILQQVPVYSLACLPDADAARLVYSSLKDDGRL